MADTDILAAVAGWLPTARWFADKDVRIEASKLELVEEVPLASDPAATDLRLLLVRLAGESQRGCYVVPVRRLPSAASSSDFLDAATSSAFASWLLHLISWEGALPGRHGRLVGRRTATGASLHLGDRPLAVAPLGGDASNTSLLVAAADDNDPGLPVLIKLIRRYRTGIQPEVEIGAFLARAGFAGSPPLLGWLEYQPANGAGESGVVATVHAGLAGTESLWDYLCSRSQQADCRPQELAAIAAALGRLTAAMHATLAGQDHHPAFQPQQPTTADAEALGRAMVEHADAVLTDLADACPAALQPRVKAVLAHQATIVDRLLRVGQQPLAASFIRVHGDYHLGQVLIDPATQKLWVIDFEGEPSRSLAQRRAKTSACKDVTGVCRSFDYLARHISRQPGSQPVAAAPLAAAFLEAYQMAATGECFWPADPSEVTRLLDAFTLDKALYELAYELHHRPDWLEVPLAAVERLLAG